MWNKCKDNQNHSLSLMLLYCWICGTSMGKVGLCTPTESRIESGMPSHYWMSKANKRRKLVFARGNFSSWNQKKCMCKSGKNQTGRERDPLPVWAHTSKKTSKVEKKLPYKCSTQFTSQQKLSESTNGKRRLEKAHAPVRGSTLPKKISWNKSSFKYLFLWPNKYFLSCF